ncbi:S66 peptidase family protein [Kribbella sp. CA-293567]|uniref:S66 peptidase family protein n=1 Tax=Kribbella sp. CA-293567 TaxID=3002436 RepID=UPI0022DE4B75|nr:LD-carboxypeptidase [Kribbella sp. CA-293567]WBQ02164.1 LD-carboxypeptidase [Kribbella sp. CA-293567]
MVEPVHPVRSITSTADESQLNDAFRDPAVRAIFVGPGNGAHRIADRLDFDAVRRDPKPVIGRGQATYLQLALWRECGLPCIHGSLAEHALTTEPTTLASDPGEISAQVLVEGRAEGVLLGGTLNAITRSIGAGLPSLDSTILLLEDTRMIGLGVIDRSLTQLIRSGVLRGVRGIALGRFTGFDGYADRDWTLVDVLSDRLANLGIPVLGGLPVGDGAESRATPIGTRATLDTSAGTLIVGAAVNG